MPLRDLRTEAVAEAEALGMSHAAANRSMDTLFRYESTIERQLYRAIDQLERLQRPVKVAVSTDV
jgi:hypothetical protein